MSLIPVIKIGFLNAWIFMIFLLAPSFILPLIFNKEKWEKRGEGDSAWEDLSKSEKNVLVVTHMIIMPFTFLYSIFLPLETGSIWFYAGLVISLLAFVMHILFTLSFLTAPLEQPITNGIYSISRHPAYFSYFLGCVGIGIACASWVFLLCSLIWIVTWNFGADMEEKRLIDRYGEAYQEYMNRTLRWLGVHKI
jgi:protein-S-isoprenylcysteine O-methyltransferase Ste14